MGNEEGFTEEVTFKLGTEGFSFNRWRRGSSAETNSEGVQTSRSPCRAAGSGVA